MSAVTILEGVELAIDLLNAITDLSAKASAVSAIIANAQKEGRATLTDDEWGQVTSAYTDAHDRLKKAIEASGN
jgi:hypothetical protein